MGALDNKAILVSGPETKRVEQLAAALRNEGASAMFASVTETAFDGATFDGAVYVAGTPSDYGIGPIHLAEYVSVVIQGALDALRRISRSESTDGSIVIITPSAGSAFNSDIVALSTASHALRGLARGWVVAEGDRAIRSNVIQPGILQGELPAAGPNPSIPLQDRLGTVDDMAAAAAFFLSDDSTYVTGSELNIDGGLAEDRQSLMSLLWSRGLVNPFVAQ
ncbi:NAD(P)-dependent dehydrogenase (short-subunit alcohol dehydrogenase family) [Mycobacterium sp. MAA66]|uniref:SDR family oxidoreductase n=1 Tax=Mycobacterium sp. MAA66 TaxID=3156297 RepID=UPI003513F864